MLTGVLLLSIVGHEFTHFIILRQGGAHPRSILRYRSVSTLLSLGLGWVYDPSETTPLVRMRSYQWANIVSTAIWVGGALVLRNIAIICLAAGLVMLVSNWYFPKTDGWYYRKLKRQVESLETK